MNCLSNSWIGSASTKFGCGVSQCGACSVLINGKLTKSCSIPVSYAVGKEIFTIEGTGILHDLDSFPLIKIEQAPHWLTPQPNFVPVKPIMSLIAHKRGISSWTSKV